MLYFLTQERQGYAQYPSRKTPALAQEAPL